MEKCCQVMVNPPAFGIQVTRVDLVEQNYVRYLKNAAYEWFGLEGTPLKIYFRRFLKLREDKELQEFIDENINLLQEPEIMLETEELEKP